MGGFNDDCDLPQEEQSQDDSWSDGHTGKGSRKRRRKEKGWVRHKKESRGGGYGS